MPLLIALCEARVIVFESDARLIEWRKGIVFLFLASTGPIKGFQNNCIVETVFVVSRHGKKALVARQLHAEFTCIK